MEHASTTKMNRPMFHSFFYGLKSLFPNPKPHAPASILEEKKVHHRPKILGMNTRSGHQNGRPSGLLRKYRPHRKRLNQIAAASRRTNRSN